MTFYRRPTKLTQTFNRFVSWLASLGLTSSDTVTLEVKGRRSGRVRSKVRVHAMLSVIVLQAQALATNSRVCVRKAA